MKNYPGLKQRTLLEHATGTLLAFLASSNAIAADRYPNKLPALKLQDLNGKIHLLIDPQDKVVMVNLWATWCPPCRAEMSSIESLYQAFKGRPFEVLGINQGESSEKIRSAMGLFNPAPTFPILIDPQSQVGYFFGVQDLPFSLIFNTQGLLVGKADGARDFSNATERQRIEELIR